MLSIVNVYIYIWYNHQYLMAKNGWEMVTSGWVNTSWWLTKESIPFELLATLAASPTNHWPKGFSARYLNWEAVFFSAFRNYPATPGSRMSCHFVARKQRWWLAGVKAGHRSLCPTIGCHRSMLSHSLSEVGTSCLPLKYGHKQIHSTCT